MLLPTQWRKTKVILIKILRLLYAEYHLPSVVVAVVGRWHATKK